MHEPTQHRWQGNGAWVLSPWVAQFTQHLVARLRDVYVFGSVSAVKDIFQSLCQLRTPGVMLVVQW